MLSNKINKKGFTLVEVLFVCSIFAIMVVGIILAINRSYSFMNNVRLQVRATNFAREGVEMMFNFRDTNRRKYSGKKDELRLCTEVNKLNNNTCNSYIGPGLYYLKERKTGNDYEVTLEGVLISSESDKDRFYNDGFWDDSFETPRAGAKIPFTGTYSYLSGGYQDDGTLEREQLTGSIEELLGSEAEFYRLVRVYGIYDKNVSSSQITSSNLKNSDPKEMRFCVKVFYRNLSTPHSTELCSIMTNFER